MKHKIRILFYTIALLPLMAEAADYDLVINHGRVIDPETQLDKQLNIGIKDGSIATLSTDKLSANKSIDASGKVVAPGFIDVHSHTPTKLGAHLNLLDGVTTQLDLEAGAFPIGAYGQQYKEGAQLHYGSSVGHFAIRIKVIEELDQPYIFNDGKPALLGGAAFTKPATKEQIDAMRVLVNQGIDQGGLGIGVLLDYMTLAISEEELSMLFEVAANRSVPIYVHVRRGNAGDPAGLLEVIELAKKTKAALFICHITHSAMGSINKWLAMIDQANEEGANITTETLSYAAGGTSIGADVFKRRDWQKIFDITYEDVQWVATGEWLTKESWDKYAAEQPGGAINHHYVKEAWLETALKWPGMMVSTDALPAFTLKILTNPNVAGTFSRVLGHYVREQKLLGLSESLAMLSLNQAQWMAQASSAFNKKGRIQPDVDADLVIFDADKVAANATYGDPYKRPSGIDYVIVAGKIIVENGERLDQHYPGIKLFGKGKQN